jgi:hypothetical protein
MATLYSWTRITLAFAFAMHMDAQESSVELLLSARAKIMDSLNRLPRYMCTQAVDRTMYEPDVPERAGSACDEGRRPRSKHLVYSDRLRLDVAIASSGELYSWVGEHKFSDRDLPDIVQDGAISTGSFGGYLLGIFSGDGATFTYSGETSKQGRTVAEFGFHVPHETSHYLFGNRADRMFTGYDGTFLVDSESGDLAHIDIRTSQLPPGTGACYVATTLDYGRVRIKNMDFLLPTAMRLQIVKTDGGEAENRSVFSSCHEFVGESTLKFDAPTTADAGRGRSDWKSQALAIPPGLQFLVALTQGIDTATAAVGDVLNAKLTTPIQDHARVLVPMGAPITARIVQIRHYYGKPSKVLLEVRLETVDVGGVSMHLAAAPYFGPVFQKAPKGALRQRVNLGTLGILQDHSASFEFRDVPQAYLIASGLESRWVTQKPEATNSAAPLP